MLIGTQVFGTGPRGQDIYKDTKGYYYIDWNPQIDKDFKVYMKKSWKPVKSKERVVRRCTMKKRTGKKKGTYKVCKWKIEKV